MSTARQRKLRNFLIYRTYQLRHTLVLVLICATIMGIMGFYLFREMSMAADVVEVGVISTMREGDARRLQEEMAGQATNRLLVMVGGCALLCLVVAGFFIVMTHGVAGPLYLLKRQMGQVRDGALGALRPLRKGDSLSDLHETFCQMTAALRQDVDLDLTALDQALAAARKLQDSAGEAEKRHLAVILTALTEIKERKTRLLGEEPTA